MKLEITGRTPLAPPASEGLSMAAVAFAACEEYMLDERGSLDEFIARKLKARFPSLAMLKYYPPFIGRKADLQYTIKLLRSVLSGFAGLQYSTWDEYEEEKVWHDCEVVPGTRARYVVEDNPYYVCACWGNRSHTPLPIILGDGEGIQGLAAQVLTEISFRLNWPILRDWRQAFIECAFYSRAHDLQEEYPVEGPDCS